MIAHRRSPVPLVAEPRVACVVVAFHRAAALRPLLDMLRHPHVEVVVVNVEDDAEVAAAAAAVRVLAVRDNVGYAAAVNLGVAACDAPVVAFMNDDLEADAESLLALAEVVATGRADVCVPQVVDAEGRREPTIASLPTPGGLLREWALLPDRPVAALRRLAVEKWRAPSSPERVDAAAAVVVVARRDLMDCEPLPEEYFLYWEESEWFWRLRRRGVVVEYEPDVRVRHRGGRDDVRAAKSALLARNAVRCVRRTQGRGRASLAWAVVLLWNLRLTAVDAARTARRRDLHRDRLRARWAGVRAAVAAWREV